jgi:hypothetical protein
LALRICQEFFELNWDATCCKWCTKNLDPCLKFATTLWGFSAVGGLHLSVRSYLKDPNKWFSHLNQYMQSFHICITLTWHNWGSNSWPYCKANSQLLSICIHLTLFLYNDLVITNFHWPISWIIGLISFVRLSFPYWFWRWVILYT